MWLSKFLDLKDDIKSLAAEVKDEIFKGRKSKKLTPLEFTILENIFNSNELSGYDLIQSLDKHFAGTWKARSGTIYPILSKLKRDGFLKIKTVKSPIGPLKKLYYLTEIGESLLKVKVNKNFLDQIKFMENFLIELASIYIKSFPEGEKKDNVKEVYTLLSESFERIKNSLKSSLEIILKCPECGEVIDRDSAVFCSLCGADLKAKKDDAESDFEPKEALNADGES